MKLFSWMKSKIHGKDNTIKPEPESSPSYDPNKEEFSGCSSTLLSIGTFGNNPQDSDKAILEEISPSSSSNDHLQFEKELGRLLNEHASVSEESERFDLSIEKIFESFPEHDEIKSDASDNEVADVLAVCSGKDTPSCSRKRSIYKKSISFLLKKAFLCGSGFAPSPIVAPILKDPFPDHNFDRSRMDKILKAMIRKKNPHQRQKYLDKTRNCNDEFEDKGKASNANNWVKTDSEYIVLDL